MRKILIDEATVKLALEMIKAARNCPPNAVDTLLFEAEEILEEALAEQPAQQEPVAFYRCNGCGHAYEQVHPTSCDCMEGSSFEQVNYYTSPQPAQRTWVDLTAEEVQAAVYDENNCVVDYENYAAVIEAKLKEKNNG